MYILISTQVGQGAHIGVGQAQFFFCFSALPATESWFQFVMST